MQSFHATESFLMLTPEPKQAMDDRLATGCCVPSQVRPRTEEHKSHSYASSSASRFICNADPGNADRLSQHGGTCANSSTHSWRSVFKHLLQQPSHNILFSKQASAIIHLPVREETAVPEAGHLVETFPHSHDKSLKSCQSYSPKMLLGT